MTLSDRWQHFRTNILRYETKHEMRERFQGVAAQLRRTIEAHRDQVKLLVAECDTDHTFIRGLQERARGYEKQIAELTEQLAIAQAPLANGLPHCVRCGAGIKRGHGYSVLTILHDACDPDFPPGTLPELCEVAGYDGDALNDVMECETPS